MKKYISFFFLFTAALTYAVAPTPLEVTIADTLASYKIIVEQKTTTGYRLGDTITRAEAVGMALKVAEVELPEKYFCRNYFRDVQYDRLNNWVCRAIEIASDYNIISRTNDVARPRTPISRIEALAIIMRAGKVPYAKNVDRTNYPKDMPQWEIDILEGALQYHIISSVGNFGPNINATRLDVFGMIYNMRFAGNTSKYITDKYSASAPLTSAPDGTGGGITITLPGNNNTSSLNAAPEIAPSTGITVTLPGRAITPTTTPAQNTTNVFNDFTVTAPKEVKVNVPFDITVRALDKKGNTFTGYDGTLYFDLLEGSFNNFTLPVTDEGYEFQSSDKGIKVFKGVLLKQAGEYKIDAYEIESGLDVTKSFTISATDGFVNTVTSQNATTLADFSISAPLETKINTPFGMIVTAVNSAGQILKNYTGTIYFDTNNIDADVLFPNGKTAYTFTTTDQGKHTFAGFQLKQLGNYELIVYEVDVIPDGVKKMVKITAKN